jgi:hypothetical protein
MKHAKALALHAAGLDEDGPASLKAAE